MSLTTDEARAIVASVTRVPFDEVAVAEIEVDANDDTLFVVHAHVPAWREEEATFAVAADGETWEARRCE
jgi:hypothetical protein